MLDFIVAIAPAAIAPAVIGLGSLLKAGKGKPGGDPAERAAPHDSSADMKALALGNTRSRMALDEAVSSHRAALRCLAAVLAIGATAAAGSADDKPKLGVQCTTAQFLKASECTKKTEQDIMNNVPNPRFVACLADGTVHCCRKSTAGPGYNCTSVRAGAAGDVTSPTGGGVMQKTP